MLHQFIWWLIKYYQINYYNSHLILCVFLMLTCKDTCTCFYIEYVQCTWKVIPIQKQTCDRSCHFVRYFYRSSIQQLLCHQMLWLLQYTIIVLGVHTLNKSPMDQIAHLGYCYFWLTKNHKQNLYFKYLVERKK